MNRITEFELGGKRYPLNFSVAAARKIDEEYGGFEKLNGVFAWESVESALKDCFWTLRLLMEQGAAYQRIFGGEVVEIPTLEEMEILLGGPDIQRMQRAIHEALGLGMEATVEVEPDPKNGETTPSKEALRGSITTGDA